jgi:hypothetical protein
MKIIITEEQILGLSRILYEQGRLQDGTKEERIAEIEKRKKHIVKLVPKMISYFNEVFGDKIYEIKTEMKGVHYGMEFHSMKIPKISFYFSSDDDRILEKYKTDIKNDIKNLFNIEIGYYGIPLDLEFYKMEWQRF